MPDFFFISFAKNAFQVSDGESPFKEFAIYNFEGCAPTYEHLEMRDKKTKQMVTILTSKDANIISKRNVPYVPVSQHLYNNWDVNLKNFRDFMKSNFSVSKIFKHKVILVLPDDCMEAEKTTIYGFLYACGIVKYPRIYACDIAHMLKQWDYVAVTKSVRAISISLVENGGILKQEFFPAGYDDIGHLKSLADSWFSEFDISEPSILLYGENMEPFSSLGTVVPDDAVLANMRWFRDSASRKWYRNIL